MTIRVVVDISGGIIHSVTATEEVEVLFIDEDDGDENPRAVMNVLSEPGMTVWASRESAVVNAERVEEIFADITWLPDSEG